MKKNIHITSGRGPSECMWVVARLLKAFLSAAKSEDLSVTIIDRVEGNAPHTLASVSVLIKGNNVEEFIEKWEGSVLWIGKSPYRKFHKRKNWFVEISTCSVSDKEELRLDEISFQTMRSSGPGGQHANKIESAVRATHKNSGLSVVVKESRSQHQNKKMAVIRLNELFETYQMQELKIRNAAQWKSNISMQRGNPKRVYEGEKFVLKKIN